jgi:hypothetical protein
LLPIFAIQGRDPNCQISGVAHLPIRGRQKKKSCRRHSLNFQNMITINGCILNLKSFYILGIIENWIELHDDAARVQLARDVNQFSSQALSFQAPSRN